MKSASAQKSDEIGDEIFRLSQQMEARARSLSDDETYKPRVKYEDEEKGMPVGALKSSVDSLNSLCKLGEVLPYPENRLTTVCLGLVDSLKQRISYDAAIVGTVNSLKEIQLEVTEKTTHLITIKKDTVAGLQAKYDDSIKAIEGDQNKTDKEKAEEKRRIDTTLLDTEKQKLANLQKIEKEIEKGFENLLDLDNGPINKELKRIKFSMQKQNESDMIRKLENPNRLGQFPPVLIQDLEKIKKEQQRLEKAGMTLGGIDPSSSKIPETGIYSKAGYDKFTESSFAGLMKNIWTKPFGHKLNFKTEKQASKIRWVRNDGPPITATVSPMGVGDPPDYALDKKGFDEAWGRCIDMLASKFNTIVLHGGGLSSASVMRHIEMVKDLDRNGVPRYIQLDQSALDILDSLGSEELDRVVKEVQSHNEKVQNKLSDKLAEVVAESTQKSQKARETALETKDIKDSTKTVEDATKAVYDAITSRTPALPDVQVELVDKLADVLQRESSKLSSKDVMSEGVGKYAAAVKAAALQLQAAVDKLKMGIRNPKITDLDKKVANSDVVNKATAVAKSVEEKREEHNNLQSQRGSKL